MLTSTLQSSLIIHNKYQSTQSHKVYSLEHLQQLQNVGFRRTLWLDLFHDGLELQLSGLGLRYSDVTAPISLHTLTYVELIKHSTLIGLRIHRTTLTKNDIFPNTFLKL